jgi:hypothetical protein
VFYPVHLHIFVLLDRSNGEMMAIMGSHNVGHRACILTMKGESHVQMNVNKEEVIYH